MENKDFQSFETVDLISPIELTPIQGIEDPFEAPDKVEEARKAPEGMEDMPQKENYADDGPFNSSQDDEWGYYKYNGKSDVDPRRIFRGEETLRNKNRDKNSARNMLVAIGLIFSVLMMVIIFVIRNYVENTINGVDRRVIEYAPEENVIVMNNYIGQDDVYGIMGLDTENMPVSDLIKLNPDVIEYTGMYQRSLYFMATPTVDNVAFEIEVQMVDRYGYSFGKVMGVMYDVPAGKEGIIEVSFGINPYDDLNDVTYNIRYNVYQIDQEISLKYISEINGQDGLVWVKIDGDESVDKYAYAVFYKNGNVVSVLYERARHDVEDIAVFETEKIDYDYFKIYY